MLKEICDQEEKFRQNTLETQRLQDTVGAPLVDTYTDFVAEEKRQVYVDADGKPMGLLDVQDLIAMKLVREHS